MQDILSIWKKIQSNRVDLNNFTEDNAKIIEYGLIWFDEFKDLDTKLSSKGKLTQDQSDKFRTIIDKFSGFNENNLDDIPTIEELYLLVEIIKMIMVEKNIYYSHRAPAAVGVYPHARKVGNLMFLSGVGPRKKGSKIIPGVTLDDDGNIESYDIEIQCRSVFDNVRYILEDIGLSWDNIVDVTVFLTNMKDDFPTYNRLYAEHFSKIQPCRTTVEINSLPTPIAIELKVIAEIPEE